MIYCKLIKLSLINQFISNFCSFFFSLTLRNSWTRFRIIVRVSSGSKNILNSILVQRIPLILIITIFSAYIVEDQPGEDQISTYQCNSFRTVDNQLIGALQLSAGLGCSKHFP